MSNQGRDQRLGRSDKHASLLASEHARQRHARPQQTAQRETLGQFIARNSTYILSVIIVIALAVIMIVIVRSYLIQPSETEEPVSSEAVFGIESDIESGAPASTVTYDWRSLVDNDGRLAYLVDGEVKSHVGIDVSENQGVIDWNAVAADGIDFVMIRLGYRGTTEGELYLDGQYEAYLEGAKAAGLDCGIYFFSQAQNTDEAIEEAKFVLDNLDGAQLEYPIAFDSEEITLGEVQSRTTGLDDNTMTDIAETFCSRIEQAGYRSIIYGNRYDLSRLSYERLDGYSIWWAEYDAVVPTARSGITMWQYANDGAVAGIDTIVDMNLDLTDVA